MTDYSNFLAAKVDFDSRTGFDIDLDDIHPALFEHQRLIVQWAVRGGRRAIFAAFGLGKSLIQLETLRQVMAREGGKALVVCPLGVRGEFARDARILGLDTRFIRRDSEVDGPGLYITNYESVRDGKLNPSQFVAVSLDEAAILRSYGSKTYQTFLPMFADVQYRYVATATPSPNRYKELIHYAGYLGIMDTGSALTRFFKRDSTKANNLTLHPHHEKTFWLWLNSWSIFLQSPADIGCDATGYDLPELDVIWDEVEADHAAVTFDRDGSAPLFKGTALSMVDAAREKRDTLDARVAKMARLVAQHDAVTDGDQIILWCDLNAEQDAIEAAMRNLGFSYSSIYGALDPDESERRLQEWRDRKTKVLIGKPIMLGVGVNLQQCNTAIYVGITHKFHDFIQSVHRVQRFGQTRRCRITIIYADSEREVKASLLEKWSQHKELTTNMTRVINEHGLSNTSIADALKRSIGVTRSEVSGEGWLLANNDCIPETRSMETGSVDLIVTSIPFGNHYSYSNTVEDLGYTDDNQHFWQQMDYLTPELLRILAPGRVYACHVKDRILFGNVTGAGIPTVAPFHAEAIFHAQKHGFDYMGMITVVTDVVRENNQTYRLGWSEQCKDATKMGVGSPEYVLLFHKPQTNREKGYADTPVTKTKDLYTRARWQVDAHAFWRSSGDRLLTTDELAELGPEKLSKLFTEQTLRKVYDYESHVRIGEELDGRGSLPATFMSLAPASWRDDVWHDVNRMLTLNGEQSKRNVEQHICPLQYDIVDRLITRFSNPDELVFDPFCGLGTVPLRALKAGRRGRGVELNAAYWLDSVKYLEAEERRHDLPTLFDLSDEAS
ncbi:DNA methyltransferase [Gordonia sp. ABSL49_1]|uniref:DNA methyltransferase n=1 Tax=Gordonia sp. ABSL49_1 TaxID=2920941 RepID=UPI001F0DA885|nr:DNA methyltransferase [Gordonia sp. ABSL49_1]MCH5645134.1 DNA methylase N-4 [Gordonia sp. ABSL49_1]